MKNAKLVCKRGLFVILACFVLATTATSTKAYPCSDCYPYVWQICANDTDFIHNSCTSAAEYYHGQCYFNAQDQYFWDAQNCYTWYPELGSQYEDCIEEAEEDYYWAQYWCENEYDTAIGYCDSEYDWRIAQCLESYQNCLLACDP